MLEKRYAVAEMVVDIINVYGNYADMETAIKKAEKMAKENGYRNKWAVLEYDGYNKWTATDYWVNKYDRT